MVRVRAAGALDDEAATRAEFRRYRDDVASDPLVTNRWQYWSTYRERLGELPGDEATTAGAGRLGRTATPGRQSMHEEM